MSNGIQSMSVVCLWLLLLILHGESKTAGISQVAGTCDLPAKVRETIFHSSWKQVYSVFRKEKGRTLVTSYQLHVFFLRVVAECTLFSNASTVA